MKHAPFGSQVPFAEPAWYRGVPTPYYNANHAKFRDRCRAFLEKEVIPFRDEWDEAQTFPLQELRGKASAAGILAPWAPAELGGTPPEGGWDYFMFLIWVDECTRVGAGGIVLLLFQIAYMSVPHTMLFGSAYLKEKYARPVIEGNAGMCITLTEPQGGSDLANVLTSAVKSADGRFYIVNGQKKFITGGTVCDFFSTLVRTGGKGLSGTSLLMIEKGYKGVTVRKLKAQVPYYIAITHHTCTPAPTYRHVHERKRSITAAHATLHTTGTASHS
jgi:alkylation response protein AidB-like acyl-CoA dehydrogenase